MQRRNLMTAAQGSALSPWAAAGPAAGRATLHLQTSPPAGFLYHAGPDVWPQLRPGQSLDLVREPQNPHDLRGVRLDWRGYKLGYLPRRENIAVSQMLDHSQRLTAKIASLQNTPVPWQRTQIKIHAEI